MPRFPRVAVHGFTNPIAFTRRIGICLALTISFIVGCPPAKVEKSEPLPFAGQLVEVWLPESLQLKGLWQPIVAEWTARTGAEVTIKEFGSSENISPLLAASPPPAGGRLVFASLADYPALAPRLAPLPASTVGIDFNDFPIGLRNALSWNKELVMIPVSAPALVCYYRKDLLDNHRLKAPVTWTEYDQLISKRNDWAPELMAIEPWGDQDRAATLAARIIAFSRKPEDFSLWFDIETGFSRWNTPAMQTGLAAVAQGLAGLSAESLQSSPTDCRQALIRGKAAIGLAWEPAVNQSSEESAPRPRPENLRLGFARLPGFRNTDGVTSRTRSQTAPFAPALVPYRGWGLGVEFPGKGKPTDFAAFALLLDVTGPQFEQTIPPGIRTVCRYSQRATAPSWLMADLTADEADAYIDVVLESLSEPQTVGWLPVPQRDTLIEQLHQALAAWLPGERKSSELTNSLQTTWDEVITRTGATTLRDHYRRALGILVIETKKPSKPSSVN